MYPQGYSNYATGVPASVWKGIGRTGRERRREAERRRRREAKQLQQLMQVRMGFTD